MMNDTAFVAWCYGKKLYGYEVDQKNDEQVNCMEQALVSNRERLAEIRNKLEVICRRL